MMIFTFSNIGIVPLINGPSGKSLNNIDLR